MSTIEQLRHEDCIAYHERRWRISKIGWKIVLLLVVGGALGLFGNGPLSKTKAELAGFQVQWHRFMHYQASDRIDLVGRVAEDTLRVTLSQPYLDDFQVDGIMPEPAAVEAGKDGVIFSFTVQPGAEVRVTFHLTPDATGLIRGSARIQDGDPLHLWHFVYP